VGAGFFFDSWFDCNGAATFAANAPTVFITCLADFAPAPGKWGVKPDSKKIPAREDIPDLLTKAV